MKKDKILKRSNEKSLLSFLHKTKEGKYAKIDKSSLPFIRIREKSELIEPAPDESFYYSVS